MRPATLCILTLLAASSAPARPAYPADSSGIDHLISWQQPMTIDRRVTVSFEREADVILALFTISGRHVGGMDFHPAGRGRIVWDLSLYDLSSGAYILVAEQGGRRDVRKILILR